MGAIWDSQAFQVVPGSRPGPGSVIRASDTAGWSRAPRVWGPSWSRGFTIGWPGTGTRCRASGGSGIAGVMAAPDPSPELFAIPQGAPCGDDALRLRANDRKYESEGVNDLGVDASG